MAKAADILEGWTRPALVIDAKGGLSVANVLFHGTGVPVERLACLRPGERLQTADDGAGAWVWRGTEVDDVLRKPVDVFREADLGRRPISG